MNRLAKYKLCGNLNATVSGKMLYLILIDIADDNGRVIIPQRRISETLGISKAAVSRNLRHLRDGGYIGIDAQYTDFGSRAPNKYRIL